jgi:hypothetical protein
MARRNNLMIWGGLLSVFIGVAPLFIAELLRRLGFDTVGFGLMWGLSFGLILALLGIVLLIVGIVIRLSGRSDSHSTT